jgi:hypothetical protein
VNLESGDLWSLCGEIDSFSTPLERGVEFGGDVGFGEEYAWRIMLFFVVFRISGIKFWPIDLD